jgi:hypothetical protein
VFRANRAGTRQNKIVLAQRRTISDPETGGSYTVKVYSSEKRGDAVAMPDDEEPVRVIAELVAVLVSKADLSQALKAPAQ